MLGFFAFHDRLCSTGVWLLLGLASRLDEWRRHVNAGAAAMRRRLRKLRGSLRNLRRSYLEWRGVELNVPQLRRRASNRIPEHVETAIVRMHVDSPTIGAGQLRHMVERVVGVRLARETVRAVLKRNRGWIASMEQARRRRPRTVVVKEPRSLWGVDLTVVWVLGFVPVWVLGVIDYHGSRLLALEPLRWPNTAAVVRVLERVVGEEGAPNRLVTDRDPIFRSAAFGAALARHGIEHTLTRPHHPWTNGRIERLFRTFKATVRCHYWVVGSRRRWAGICAEFRVFYNEHRPHQAYGGLTPREVYEGRRQPRRALGSMTFFEGRMRWWRLS